MLYQAVSSTPPQGGLTCCCCPRADQSSFQLALGEQQKVSRFVDILKYACSATALQSLEINSETIITDHYFFHFAQYMGWWPNSELGILSWLQMLPTFFAPAAPILFFIDW